MLRLTALITLLAAPATAQTEARLALANRITELSLDIPPAPATPEPGFEYELFPPFTSASQKIVVAGCTLTMQAYAHDTTLISELYVDLSFATLARDETGRPFGWSRGNGTSTSTVGILSFDLPPGHMAHGRYRVSPRDIEDFRASTPSAWPFEPQRTDRPTYIMWVEPTSAIMAALAGAIAEYQTDYCRPLS